jgi:3-dehydroquinate dehydratase II
MARVLVLHGPNLSLGPAETAPSVIDARLSAKATALGAEVRSVASNREGDLLDALVENKDWLQAVIVNPTSLAPVAFGLAEALTLLKVPAIEVQLGSPGKGKSALKDAVDAQLHGKGIDGYLEALAQLVPRAASKALAVARSDLRKVESSTALEAVLAAAERAAEESSAAPPDRSKRAVKEEEPEDEPEEAPRPRRAEVKPPKTLGRNDGQTPLVNRAVDKRPEKTIGERATTSYTLTPPPKTLGKKAAWRKDAREAQEPHGILTRARVREQIAERLAGTMTPAALATWARARWADLQAGSPAESGQRDRLEEVLQTLIVAAAGKASDQALIELMVQLER